MTRWTRVIASSNGPTSHPGIQRRLKMVNKNTVAARYHRLIAPGYAFIYLCVSLLGIGLASASGVAIQLEAAVALFLGLIIGKRGVLAVFIGSVVASVLVQPLSPVLIVPIASHTTIAVTGFWFSGTLTPKTQSYDPLSEIRSCVWMAILSGVFGLAVAASGYSILDIQPFHLSILMIGTELFAALLVFGVPLIVLSRYMLMRTTVLESTAQTGTHKTPGRYETLQFAALGIIWLMIGSGLGILGQSLRYVPEWITYRYELVRLICEIFTGNIRLFQTVTAAIAIAALVYALYPYTHVHPD